MNDGLNEQTSSKPPRRRAGILFHPTSFPGPWGIGDLGPGAERFLEWAQSAGQTLWQILPLGPTARGGSPYNALSAFAGNPLLISPELLFEQGLLHREDLEAPALGDPERIELDRVAASKLRLLRRSWERARRELRHPIHDAIEPFRTDPLHEHWLEDWIVFAALTARSGSAAWRGWGRGLARRDPSALATARAELQDEMDFQRYLQVLFFQQWSRIRHIAEQRGISILGDVPIYVADDSADVWSHPDFFDLDESLRPRHVAGVPPDYFSKTGQRWGNPLYRWDRMAQNGYRWWIERFRLNLALTHQVRLDHFRGFAGYWQIPASEPTAIHGQWVEGPGFQLFEVVRKELGSLPFIAEDLGTITPDVDALREALGLPGMKVLQFGFGDLDNIHLPHHYVRHMVAYTGTHDNDTTRGWMESLTEPERRRLFDYLGVESPEAIAWACICVIYRSVADLAIAPLQDVLALGSDARMNTPGRKDENWGWRVREDQLTEERAAALRRLAELTGRISAAGE